MPSRAHQTGQRTGSTDARPGRYELGSPESRAAARALLDSRKATQGQGILIKLVSVLGCDDPDRKCTCPVPEAGSIGMCRCFL